MLNAAIPFTFEIIGLYCIWILLVLPAIDNQMWKISITIAPNGNSSNSSSKNAKHQNNFISLEAECFIECQMNDAENGLVLIALENVLQCLYILSNSILLVYDITFSIRPFSFLQDLVKNVWCVGRRVTAALQWRNFEANEY